MLVFRSFAIGLLASCLVMLVVRPRIQIVLPRPAPPPRVLHRVVAEPAATIIDVAPGLGAAQIAPLVHLAPGERVVALDDRRVPSELAAGAELAAELEADLGTPHRFVDLAIAGPGGARRVLVLLH
ncbi:MAG TPA: hypothetical protein VGF94_12770 [Kofleriaceae bacterium]|jgi:hypothetical protein